jgi:hypothetical protein
MKGTGWAWACVALAVLGCTSAPDLEGAGPGSCGVRATANAGHDVLIMGASNRFLVRSPRGNLDTQAPQIREGESRWLATECANRCLVLVGAGVDPRTGQGRVFLGSADLVPGEWAYLRLDERQAVGMEGSEWARNVARAQGCVTD